LLGLAVLGFWFVLFFFFSPVKFLVKELGYLWPSNSEIFFENQNPGGFSSQKSKSVPTCLILLFDLFLMAGVGSITYSEKPPTKFLVYLKVILQMRNSLVGISNSKTPPPHPPAGISLFKMLVSINF
jgi:hypothetical protein